MTFSRAAAGPQTTTKDRDSRRGWSQRTPRGITPTMVNVWPCKEMTDPIAEGDAPNRLIHIWWLNYDRRPSGARLLVSRAEHTATLRSDFEDLKVIT